MRLSLASSSADECSVSYSSMGGGSSGGGSLLQPESFDYVMLDPPCSALGLRPRLQHDWSLHQLRKMAAYQVGATACTSAPV